MAKFTFAAVGNPDDPFGYQPERTVKIPDSRPAGYDPYALVQDPNDYFSYRSPVAEKRTDSGKDYFGFDLPPSNLIDVKRPPSEIGRTSKMGSAVDGFALVKTTPTFFDEVGMGDSPASGHSRQEFELVKMPTPSWDAVGLGDTVPDDTFTKGAPASFSKFCQFTKVQETGDGDVLVWGIATREKPDLDGEICDYEDAKKAYQAWSTASATRTSAAGQQISLGPIRLQHSIEPAGKATKLEYDDDAKAIWLGSVPINDEIRSQLQQGFLTGYSQGGSYAWRECADCGKSLSLQQANNYCPTCKKNVQVLYGLKRLSEVSYVDSACSGEGFDYVKRDGTSKFVTFAKRNQPASAKGFRILSTERLYRKIYKSVAMIDGRRRTVLTWPGGYVVA